MSENPAFQALADLSAQCRKSAHGLPAQVEAAPRWSGIGFSVLGQRFVAPMSHVAELMEVPGSTRLPGVHPWVLGLSNVRGRLLPLFDLAQFFGGGLSAQKKHHRVLVLETGTLYSGVVVEMAFGMQHFTADSYGECTQPVPTPLAPFVEGAYHDQSGETWPVFSMARLAQDSRFNNAAFV
ncbi:chemotaxis protein CheW [Teredinibacter waterburyi]|jgi:Chemotaxis signal transduction protein|uniref:chemotaxis protein CheW n=1 Tax=Teredinibacter waterburyi TaxID=1500538 RepID=UPI00165ED6DD|nr:chemotaxis protein CheW [Teredinibacter waterburyi]